MAYTSEIEKLEARYRENPKGRNFAPLADAYRKAGLIDNAIELCQAGLQLHPDYVSGHIVHGRCLVDKKDDTNAELVFRRVLELDPENILALKVLAEIAERTERFDTAVEWLNRLLMADPMNGEAGEGLSRVRGKAAAQAEVAVPPTPPAAPAPPPEEPVATLLMTDAAEPESAPPPPPVEEPAALDLDTPLAVEHEEPARTEIGTGDAAERAPRISLEHLEGPFDAGLADADTAAMGRPEFELERTSETAPLETFDGLDFGAVTPGEGVVEGLQLEEPEQITPDTEMRVEGLAGSQYEGSGLFKMEPGAEQPEEPAAPAPSADLPLILPEELEPEPEPARETEPLEVVSGSPAPPAPLLLPDDDGAADTAALSQVEPVVTETMAELYLQQGHREDARRVYEALSERRPDDARLRQRVVDLSGGGPATGAPPSAPEGRTARTSGGQSAGAFLKGILNARPGVPAPPAPAPVPAPPPVSATPSRPTPAADEAAPPPVGHADQATPGSPTRPASDSISLDSVFGEEAGRGSAPAEPEVASEQPGKLPKASGGFSFDDFFGTAATGGGTSRPSAPTRAPRPSGRHRSSEQDEDLDQFQAWLKSLKA